MDGLTWNRPAGVYWSEGDGVPELLEVSHKAGGQALLVGALEVIGPKIPIDTPRASMTWMAVSVEAATATIAFLAPRRARRR